MQFYNFMDIMMGMLAYLKGREYVSSSPTLVYDPPLYDSLKARQRPD